MNKEESLSDTRPGSQGNIQSSVLATENNFVTCIFLNIGMNYSFIQL